MNFNKIITFAIRTSNWRLTKLKSLPRLFVIISILKQKKAKLAPCKDRG